MLLYDIHPDNPQARLVKQAAMQIQGGGIAALPTDSNYALVARLDDKDAAQRIRRLRGVDDRHHMTLLCADLSQIATYARVDNRQYRLLKSSTPGPFTFILEATREVPRRLSHPSRKTIGIRVPDHPIALMLLEQIGEPLMSTTLIPQGETAALNDVDEIRGRYQSVVDLVVDAGPCADEPTTVVDLTQDPPELLRRGAGAPERLGLVD
jgi:tRNA threonylcarbamoyl adenosine modification protein (Sua5/YciO/YrdC/YwlC family)